MKNIKRHIALLLLLSVAILGGCVRRPLEVIYRSTVRVIVKCIWSVESYPEGQKPTGVTFYFFRDGEFYTSLTTANVDSCEVHLEKGHYRMYMISQSPEEFWKMDFENMNSFSNAATTLRETKATWATRGEGEVPVENPEILLAGVTEEFDITEEMSEEYQYYYSQLRRILAAESGGTKSVSLDEKAYYQEQVEYHTLRIPVYPKNIVSQMWVTIYAGNADVLKSVRASTSGMARTWELTQGVTSGDEAIQIINQWNLTIDDPARRVGHIDGIINTFGLPNGEMPSGDRDPSLNVSALLIDNTTAVDYIFPVGDKISILEPNRGYRHLYRLVFGSVDNPAITPPDVKPVSGGGMDAQVTDWEEGETIEIPM